MELSSRAHTQKYIRENLIAQNKVIKRNTGLNIDQYEKKKGEWS